MLPIVLSHFQATPLLAARQTGQSHLLSSSDLNLTRAPVTLDAAGVTFAGGESVGWDALATIAESESACFTVQAERVRPIRGFSELTNRVYSLYPTAAAPTMLVSGIPMHRIKGTNPHLDTLAKIKALAPISGAVLDTTTGLGYTAIAAARTASQVLTIELDPTAQEMAAANPWSQALFDRTRITQLIGDSAELVPDLPSETFDCIIHDPPTLSLAGDLYSGIFYQALYRVLKRRGRLFHYIGDLDSQSGSRVTRGVVRRLQEAGFLRISERPQAFGLVAVK